MNRDSEHASFLDALHDYLLEKVRRHDTAIFGNGNPGLKQDVAMVKQSQERFEAEQRRLEKRRQAQFSGLASFVTAVLVALVVARMEACDRVAHLPQHTPRDEYPNRRPDDVRRDAPDPGRVPVPE